MSKLIWGWIEKGWVVGQNQASLDSSWYFLVDEWRNLLAGEIRVGGGGAATNVGQVNGRIGGFREMHKIMMVLVGE